MTVESDTDNGAEYAAIKALLSSGFQVLFWHHRRVPPAKSATGKESYSVPRDLIGSDANGVRKLIVWREKGDELNGYDFAGWAVYWGTMSGGLYRTLSGALGWFQWAEKNNQRFNYTPH